MTPKQKAYINKHYKTKSNHELAEKLGVSYQTVAAYKTLNKLKGKITSPDEIIHKVLSKKKDGDEKAGYKKAVSQLSSEIDDLKKKLELATSLEDNIVPTHIRSISSSPDESVAFAIASDWHYEEIVKSTETNGLNTFNPRIGDQRINAFFTNTVKLLKKEAEHSTIDTLVLALLGDFITNSNLHDDTPEYCALGVFESLNAIENHIIGGIKYILDNTKVNLVIPTAVGNHSRVTKKVHITRETSNSLETILYAHVARYFEGNKRVTVILPNSYLSYLTLWNKYTVCFHHGHAVSYGGGVGGLTVPMNKAIANWERNKHADLYVCGHFHTAINGGKFMVNSSLIGYNAYAIFIKAAFEVPSQWFFLVSKKHNRQTITAPILLD
jgi:DNA-binding CsgD family transcriptional regulator